MGGKPGVLRKRGGKRRVNPECRAKIGGNGRQTRSVAKTAGKPGMPRKKEY